MDKSDKNDKNPIMPIKIVFSRWIDPLKQALVKHRRNKESIVPEEWSTKGDFDEIADYEGPAIKTSNGFIPLNDAICASAHFNFWVGHTNFLLTHNHRFTIGMTPGVESVEVNTPYRFRVAIAKLFNEKDTLNRIEKAIQDISIEGKMGVSGEISEIDARLVSSLSKQFKFFVIATTSESKRILHGETQIDVENQLVKYRADYPDCKIYCSWKGA